MRTIQRQSSLTIRRSLAALLVMCVALMSAPSMAQDVKTLRKDVASATDFRVRVAAALVLGKKKDVASIEVLAGALSDENSTVRAAAAAALGSIGDPRAIESLDLAKRKEKDKNVSGAIARALLQIKGRTRVVVALGKFENKSGNPKLSSTFSGAARSELAKLPGVEVGLNDAEAVQMARAEKVPVIALDGQLTRISSESSGGDVGYQARVEFVIRKIPEQSLKATVKGNAKASAEARSVKGAADHSQLQMDAVTAAVQSALSAAPKTMEEAGK